MKQVLCLCIVLILSFSGCKARNQVDINNGISSSKVLQNIEKGKAVLIQGMIITDDLDFTKVQNQTVFSSSQRIAEVDVAVTFLNCVFLGNVKTNGTADRISITTRFNRDVTFEGCDFRGDVDFSNAIVCGLVNFAGAVFREDAIFNNSTFMGRQTYFTAFSAEKVFSMQEAAIGGSIDFFKGRTKGRVSFQSTGFTGVARFSDLECEGKADFSLATFRSNALFTYAKFKGGFGMDNASCEANCDFVSVTFGNPATIRNSIFKGKMNFSKAEAQGSFDLSNTLFVYGKPVVDGLKLTSHEKISTSGTRFNNFTPYEYE